MNGKQVCILSPHQDDAAFSCGLMLRSFLLAGVRVRMVNVCTMSTYAPFSSAPAATRETISELRRQEDHAFIDLLFSTTKADRSLLETTDLGWLDAPLRWEMREEQTLRPHELRVEEVNRLAEEIKDCCSAGIVLAPLAVGGHVDHRLVKTAALLSVPMARLAFYEELPYASRVEEAQVVGSGTFQVRSDQPGNAQVPAAFAWEEWGRRCYPDQPGQPQYEPGMKLRYARCYGSQIDEHTAREISDYSEALGGRERLQAPASVLDQIDECF